VTEDEERMAGSVKRVLSLFISTIALSACDVSGQNLTFLEIIDRDPTLSTFAQAIDAAKFNFAVYGFPLTLFAPNNVAFDNLDPVFRARSFSPGWSAHLKYLLETHLLRGSYPSSSFSSLRATDRCEWRDVFRFRKEISARYLRERAGILGRNLL
jgi:Fasciclin domain